MEKPWDDRGVINILHINRLRDDILVNNYIDLYLSFTQEACSVGQEVNITIETLKDTVGGIIGDVLMNGVKMVDMRPRFLNFK